MFDGHGARRNNIQQEHLVCNVRSGQEQERRKIETNQVDPYTHFHGGICIDGAIYYGISQSRIIRFELFGAPEESHILGRP
ncbi:unnamed protein product [Arabis nemorensis]|uniref:Uncharacterized protein n=1 Tax=Arabis nemorensis TaxID=586526 RepID=A0A565C6B3_9BRAS|nr:unnamed protein product [Arabis nemorensis]